MKGYKGFEPGLVCRDKQYAENTIFREEKAEPCASGMHFCEDPFEALRYYPVVDDNGNFNEFAEVEALDEPVTDDGKKFASTELKIGAKFSFKGFIDACVNFALKKTKFDNAQTDSGDSAQIGSSGDFAQIGSSGNYAQIGSSGDSAKIGSSGDSAKIGSSGDSAQIGSSGYSAKIGSSGNYAKIGSSGDYAKIGSSGKNSVIMCAGNGSKTKAKKGSWITLAEWQTVGDEWKPVCVKTEQVDGERIKEDTFYKLKGGEFVECE